MYKGIGWCDSWNGESVVTEIDCVKDVEGLCLGVDEAMGAVVFEGDANLESVRAMEVPGAAGG